MADSILAGLALETTQEQLLGSLVLLMAAMLEKMPRVNGNDQLAAAVETGTVAVTGSLTNVTGYLGDVRAAGTKFISGDNLMLSGTQHIYSNITVS